MVTPSVSGAGSTWNGATGARELEVMPDDSFGTRATRWFQGGRGWTWGAASHGPVRDVGLDRLMADTLASSQPIYSRDPAPSGPAAKDAWQYASSGSVQPAPARPIDDQRQASRLEAAQPRRRTGRDPRWDDLPPDGPSDEFEAATAEPAEWRDWRPARAE
jgi:hypothetical protein